VVWFVVVSVAVFVGVVAVIVVVDVAIVVAVAIFVVVDVKVVVLGVQAAKAVAAIIAPPPNKNSRLETKFFLLSPLSPLAIYLNLLP
jgi:hypothetical protein